MDPRLRLAVVVALALLTVALAALLFFESAGPPDETKLQSLIAEFMECVPDETSAAERDEIRGILDRFDRRAFAGQVAADDVAQIENDLRGYVERGKIPEKELFDFMSKVGKATRRMDPAEQTPED